MSRRGLTVSIGVVAVMLVATSVAATPSYPWRDHDAPFDHTFGNHMDDHQQTKLLAGDKKIQGFLYVDITDTIPEESSLGLPEAKHIKCNEKPDDCEVGWVMHGVAWENARYCGHFDGHHQWQLLDGDTSKYERRGYTHFHWNGPEPDKVDDVGTDDWGGYFMKLTAVDSFYFVHHGPDWDITPGVELESHFNLTKCDPAGN